ncbi:MAG: 16S rRNA (cytidine(1402)-2'-O)-methyltransferase [Brachymonas sp.]|nr:16S rRNA (cytidine(1402)-2'-O)-methyltransferase [Brachymonas sp.]
MMDFASALQAASAVADGQSYPQGCLYLVATPIGNLADISLRALHVLRMADVLACEDTRHTQALLRAWGMPRPAGQLLALHQHNEKEATQAVVQRLQQGQRVAYVSDAGTPAISDPGAHLVQAVQAAGLRVMPIPGASSVITALSASGADTVEQGNGVTGAAGGWVFAGFLPVKGREREQSLAALQAERRAVVLLEAPHRISALCNALEAFGSRQVTLARELTKQFESITTLPAHALADWLQAAPERSKGEFVLVLHPLAQQTGVEEGTISAQAEHTLRLLLAELPLKTAVKLAAEISGSARNALYERALALKQES